MFNSKHELVKKSAEIASKKYPNGYNKSQLIECSKEVYDGFGAEVLSSVRTKKICTMDDVNSMGNAMAQIDGHYPVGMSGCYVVGINGDCGLNCPVYLEGNCGVSAEMYNDGNGLTGEEKELHVDLYGEMV